MAPQTKRKAAPRRPAAKKKSGGRNGRSRLGGAVGGIGGHGAWWTRMLRWFAFLGVAGVLAGALTFFVLYRAIEIPNANAEFQTQTTKVMYSDNKNQIGSFATQDRENVTLDQIPASMQAAAIAAEDRSFYTNRGIDLKGIVRAVRDNATSGEIRGGGSTITQQYVKILYLTQEQSYKRKIKEAVLSIKIHNQLSKKEILEGYLNTIYFGNGAYGVEVASKTYFDKPASDLNYAQSAMLATLVNSPTYYDPYTEGAAERISPRFNYVLDGMLKSGAITSAEREKFRDRVPGVVDQKSSSRFSGSKGYLLQLVKDKMKELDFSSQQVDGGGLRIVTTFDHDKQQEAVEAVKEFRPDAKQLNQSLVSVQPGTGAVRSMYGGRDFLKSNFNWATEKTQPGSTFKPFAVIAALDNGYSLRSRLNGNSPLMKDGEQIAENQGDSGGQSFGSVDLAFATQKSINTAFVDLVDQMDDGPDQVLAAAQQAGIPASVIDPVKEGSAPLVTPLGYFPVAPVDMANAYATIAAEGKRAEWYVIEKVADENGTEMYEHEVKTKRTIPKDVAADTIAAMQRVVNSGGAGTGSNGRTVCSTAGKTGTATFGPDDDQHVSSSWFAGFTPKLATAVMYNRGKNGNADLEGYMLPAFFGGQIPAQTFQAYMNAAIDPSSCGSFPPPANIQAEEGTVYRAPAPAPKPKPKPKPQPTKTQAPEPEPTQTTEPEPEPAPTKTPKVP